MNYTEKIITNYQKIPTNLKYVLLTYFSISIVNFGWISFLSSFKTLHHNSHYTKICPKYVVFFTNLKHSLLWPCNLINSANDSIAREYEYDSEDDEYY